MAIYSKERLSSSSLTKWPFDSMSNVPVHVSRLFSDAIVDLPADSSTDVCISGVRTSGGVISFTATVFGEEIPCRESVSGEGYTTVSCGPYFRVVVDNAHVCDRDIDDPGVYRVDKACIVEDNAKVRSLTIMNSEDGVLFPVVTKRGIVGDVTFLAGNNMVVSASSPEAGDGPTGVRLEAVPGAGTGVVPCNCEPGRSDDMPFLKPGKANDVVIIGDGCINVSVTDYHTLRLDGRCSACCPLEKCVDMANELSVDGGKVNELHDDVSSEAGDLSGVITEYNRNLMSAFDGDARLYVSAMRSAYSYETGKKASDRNIKILGRLTSIVVSGEVMNRSNAITMNVVLRHVVPGMMLTSQTIEMTDSSNGARSAPIKVGDSFRLSPRQRAVFSFLFSDEDVVERAVSSVSGVIKASFSWVNPDGKSYSVIRNGSFTV